MKQIHNIELAVASVGRWYPGDLAFIDALDYRCSTSDENSCLRLVARFQRRDTAEQGWPDENAGFTKIILVFTGVANLQIKAFGPSAKQIMGFEIRDVSERRLEKVRFLVDDYEGGQISFECEDVSIGSM